MPNVSDEDLPPMLVPIRDGMFRVFDLSVSYGVPFSVSAPLVIGIAAKALKGTVGPAEASAILRQLADIVEADGEGRKH